MTDVEAIPPCIRGCVWDSLEDEEPRPKPALHGDLCDSCFYRIVHALKLVPDLMANMRAQVNGFGAAPLSERVSGGGDGSPAPLRIAPLDALDSLYAKLVGWTVVFSEQFGVKPPEVPSWVNRREVQGMRPVSIEATHLLASYLRDWYLDRLEQIAGTPLAAEWHDDLCNGWEDARGVFSLAKAYGVEARPAKPAEKRVCPVCSAVELFVKPPDKLDDSVEILCGRCAYVVPRHEAKYAEYLEEIA